MFKFLTNSFYPPDIFCLNLNPYPLLPQIVSMLVDLPKNCWVYEKICNHKQMCLKSIQCTKKSAKNFNPHTSFYTCVKMKILHYYFQWKRFYRIYQPIFAQCGGLICGDHSVCCPDRTFSEVQPRQHVPHLWCGRFFLVNRVLFRRTICVYGQ